MTGNRLAPAAAASFRGGIAALMAVALATGGQARCLSAQTCVIDNSAEDFYTVPPCRLVDTRNAPGPLAGPALTSGTLRSFALVGACSLPPAAEAISLNITVVGPTGGGFLSFSPNCSSFLTSTINFSTGQTRANNAILPLDGNGILTVSPEIAGTGSVHLILDLNGYFSPRCSGTPYLAGLVPDPPPAGNQVALTFGGANLVQGAFVTLYDLSQSGTAYRYSTTFITCKKFEITANLRVGSSNWTAQVTNPDGSTSNVLEFTVQSP